MSDDKEKHQIDLEKGEYWETKRGAPILGPNGPHFLLLFFLSFPLAAIARWLITGEWPDLVLRLVQSGH